MNEGAPAITSEDDTEMDETLVVNGSIDVRKTHPNLYLSIMLLAVGSLALGVNFFVFTPTFRVYNQSNDLWGAIFLAIGLALIVSLNLYRRLRLVRAVLAFNVAYLLFFGIGTMQPALEGKGSLQLPILYGGLVAMQLPLLLEPFINPWTAKRD